MSDDNILTDLPSGLVDEVLNQSKGVGDELLKRLAETRRKKEDLRSLLWDSGLVWKEGDVISSNLPTTCGTDGSYVVERLLSVDMAFAASVAIEGLAPPTESRFWEAPRHTTIVQVEPQCEKTPVILRACMLGEELSLACKAPHDVVMLDMGYQLPVIYFNQGLSGAKEHPGLGISKKLFKEFERYAAQYLEAVAASRSDKQFAALPKYSSKNEVGTRVKWDVGQSDRSILSLLLEAGELTKPIPIEQPDEPFHISTKITNSMTQAIAGELGYKEASAGELVEEAIEHLNRAHVFYYKPQSMLPAFRVEIAANLANNKNRLGVLLQGLKMQCGTGAMMEPYPLYMADRMVKSLAKSAPALRQVITQRVAELYEYDISEIYFALHGYRSDSGR